MFRLNEAEVEWALKHLIRFYSSDFFPQLFEFEILKADWKNVKEHLLNIDLSEYTPKTPITVWAPKANGTFRCVHQLEPLDSIIYTALVKQQARVFEGYQIAESEGIACAFRLDPDLDGSFFGSSEDGWNHYKVRTRDLVAGHANGIVVVCDFVEFYGQTRQLRNVIAEAGGVALEEYAKVIENFLHCLNGKTSQGLPVGSAASVVLAEVLLANIDRKIQTYTSSFVRWVDGFRIFFQRTDEAVTFLHDFTRYLYGVHRLVLSGEKTRLLRVSDFRRRVFRDEEQMQCLEPQAKAEEAVDEDDFAELQKKLHVTKRAETLAETYLAILSEQLNFKFPNFLLLRVLFKNAARYRIRRILKPACENLERLLPIIREVSIYVRAVLDPESAESVGEDLRQALESAVFQLPYANLWIAYIFQDEAFNDIDLSAILFSKIVSLRDQALIARRRGDRAWVNANKGRMNGLEFWERRAILYAASVLPRDEMEDWLDVAGAYEDKVEDALRIHMRSKYAPDTE